MSKSIVISIMVILFLLLSGGPAGAMDKIILQLKWYHQFQFAGYYAALEKGYFREEGLDVEIRPGGVDIYCIEEVIQGRAQFGVAGAELLRRRLNGDPVVVLAVIFQHSPSIILARRDSGIRSPHDLIGRKIMLSEKDEQDIWAMLIDEGIGRDRIRLAKTTWDIEELVDGRVDAMAAYSTNTPFLLEERGIASTIIRPRTYGVDFYGDSLFCSERELKEYPQRVAKFRKATLMGWDYAMQHPQEIIRLIVNKYNPWKKLAHLEYEAVTTRELIVPDLVEMGHMNPGRWNRMAEIFVKLGMAKPAYTLDGFIYDPKKKSVPAWLIRVAVILSVTALMIFGYTIWLRRFSARLEKAVADLERADRFNITVLNSLTSHIAVLDRDGFIVKVNEAWLQFGRNSGLKALEKIGEGVNYLQVLDDSLLRDRAGNVEEIRKDLDRLLAGGIEEYNLEYRCDSPDRVLWYLMSARSMKALDGGAVVAHIDITSQKEAEEKMLYAKKAAESLHRTKTYFVDNISHELRTPLNPIIVLSDLLLESDLSEEQKAHLVDVNQSGKKLLALVDDLIELSRLDSLVEGDDRQPFSLKSAVEHTLHKLLPAAEKKGLTVTFEIADDVPQLIHGDWVLLNKILLKIGENAIKFSDKGEIAISITREDQGKEDIRLRFSIRDHGVGINPERLKFLFQDFTQADGSKTRRYGGIGLGLTMVRKIVEIMGGTIHAESREGAGTTFHIVLPFGLREF